MSTLPVIRDLDAARIVAVNCEVSFRDEATQAVHRVTLVDPGAASIPERRISVLSPVGRALLGRRVGARTVFTTPAGERREIRVLEMHYQPDAAGDPSR